MTCTHKKILLTVLTVITIGLWFTTAEAQTPPKVDAILHFGEYDVIYLTDFLDVKTQKLNPNISGISLDLNVIDPPGGTIKVRVYIQADVQLRGDPGLQYLVKGFTNDFEVRGMRTLAARDFAGEGNKEIYMLNAGYDENKPLRKRLEDIANTIPTAPPGTYRISMKVLRPGATITTDTLYGSATETIVIPLSAAEEVFVEINDPKDGEFFSSLAPTFSWTTGASNVTVKVFEALPTHRSPQDALTGGSPNLVRDLTGITSLTYPADAERQLQQGKAYVLQINAKVVTNRGEVTRSSRPVVFRITDDKVGQMLDNFLNAFSGSASATYSTLRADPSNWVYWSAYGQITLDGSTLTETDLQSLLNDLASRSELKLQLGVENQ